MLFQDSDVLFRMNIVGIFAVNPLAIVKAAPVQQVQLAEVQGLTLALADLAPAHSHRGGSQHYRAGAGALIQEHEAFGARFAQHLDDLRLGQLDVAEQLSELHSAPMGAQDPREEVAHGRVRHGQSSSASAAASAEEERATQRA